MRLARTPLLLEADRDVRRFGRQSAVEDWAANQHRAIRHGQDDRTTRAAVTARLASGHHDDVRQLVDRLPDYSGNPAHRAAHDLWNQSLLPRVREHVDGSRERRHHWLETLDDHETYSPDADDRRVRAAYNDYENHKQNAHNLGLTRPFHEFISPYTLGGESPENHLRRILEMSVRERDARPLLRGMFRVVTPQGQEALRSAAQFHYGHTHRLEQVKSPDASLAGATDYRLVPIQRESGTS